MSCNKEVINDCMRSIIEKSEDVLIIHDLHGEILAANQRASDLFAIKKAQLTGKNIATLLAKIKLCSDGDILRKLCEDGHLRFTSPLNIKNYTLHQVEVRLTILNADRGIGLCFIRDTTDLQRAERALQKSEEAYRELINNQGEGIGFIDQNDRFIFSNPAAEEIFGVSPQSLVGRSLSEFVDNSAFSFLQEETYSRGGKKTDYEIRIQRPDGQLRDLLITITPKYSDEGNFEGIFSIFRDNTDRKQAERALRENELSLKKAQQLAHIGSWEWNIKDNTFRLSEELCRIYGLPVEKRVHTLESVIYNHIHPDDRASIAEAVSSLVSDAKTETLQYRVLRPDGDIRWVQSTQPEVLRLDGNGNPEILIGAAQDITEHKAADDALRTSEEQFRAQYQGIPLPTVTWKKVENDFILVNYNDAAVTISEGRIANFLGKKLSELHFLSPDLIEDFSRCFSAKISSRRTVNYLVEATGENKILSVTIAFVPPDLVMAHMDDITEHKRMMELLRENENFVAVGRMAARIAHEINNPLGGIKNSFLLIKDAVPAHHPHYEYVGRIEREIDRIAAIVRQMLELYRPGQEPANRFNLDDCLRDIIALVIAADDHQVRCDLHVSRGAVSVLLPEGLLRQVLFNILKNALEASPPAGLVTVRAKVERGNVCIDVADQGEGIAEEIRPQLFDPFFTTKNSSAQSGLGLGLPISKKIIETLNGTLEFESEAGHGTVFKIRIPCSTSTPSMCISPL